MEIDGHAWISIVNEQRVDIDKNKIEKDFQKCTKLAEVILETISKR